jgi:AraC-like DNA-binding protein
MPELDILFGFFAMLERRGFELTINDFSGLIVSEPGESARFAPWFIHRNPYCMKIKSDPRLWNECLRRKTALCAAASGGGLFRGMCFCGREEYIMPVIKDGIVLATIGLGGFVSDRSQALARAERTMRGMASATDSAVAAVDTTGAAAVSAAIEELGRAFDASFGTPRPGEEDALAMLGLAAASLLRHYEGLEALRGALVVPGAARLSRERRLSLHAADYLRRHVSDPVTAGDVAAACHVSMSTLSHIFKKSMGLGIAAWLGTVRIEKAKAMLARGASVTETALECGFGDPNYFSRVFSKSEGMPPGRWVRIGADSPSARLAP